jgi:hypothetical protein
VVSSRRSRTSWLWVLIPALAGIVVVGLALFASQRDAELADAPIEGVVETQGLEAGLHTTDDVTYPATPPTGGRHDPVWAACDGRVFTEPVREENAVHSLEHGAVWITYRDDLPADQVETLAGLVDGTPYTMLSPLPGQESPVVLTAWGLQLAVDSADDDRIERFLDRYRQGPQTPEVGASCAAVEGSPVP